MMKLKNVCKPTNYPLSTKSNIKVPLLLQWLLRKLPPYAFRRCKALHLTKDKARLWRVAIHERVLVYFFALLHHLIKQRKHTYQKSVLWERKYTSVYSTLINRNKFLGKDGFFKIIHIYMLELYIRLGKDDDLKELKTKSYYYMPQ